MKTIKHRVFELRLFVVIASAFVAAMFVLSGCKREVAKPVANNTVNNAASSTPTPQATPPQLDSDADRVRRASRDDVTFLYAIFLNGERLKLSNKYEVDAVEAPDDLNAIRVLVPLRVIGERLGYKVNWNYRKRRVNWNGNIVPAPVTLIGGLSYFSPPRMEKYLQRFDKSASVEVLRFDRTAGYIQIEAKNAKRTSSR